MLTTVEQIKILLNIPASDTTQDVQLTGLHIAAEGIFLNMLKRNLEVSSYTEYYAGNSQRSLVLRNRPVLSISSIHEDFQGYNGSVPGAFGPNTLLTEGIHYTLNRDLGTDVSCSGLVQRIGGVWMEIGRVYFPGKLTAEIGPTLGNIKITYIAGYDVIPVEIEYAIALLVSSLRRNIGHGAYVVSERLGEYSYTLSSGASGADDLAIASVKQIISRYREQSL